MFWSPSAARVPGLFLGRWNFALDGKECTSCVKVGGFELRPVATGKMAQEHIGLAVADMWTRLKHRFGISE